MSKIAIFTIILSISVITVTADLVMRSYFEKQDAQTSVITEDEEASAENTDGTVSSEDELPENSDIEKNQSTENLEALTEDANPSEVVQETTSPPPQTPIPPSSTITQFLATQAGFNGTLAEDHFNGKVYQLLDITKYPVEAISLYKIQEESASVATITEIALRDEITALQLYVLLQNKTKPYIDLSLNETNAYGDRSFYINHSKKTDEAFLTVEIGKMIYAFAYVKSYHPQIKQLINLLNN